MNINHKSTPPLSKRSLTAIPYNLAERRSKTVCLTVAFFLVIFSGVLCIPAQNTLARFEKSIDEGNFAAVEKDLFNYVVANPKDANGFLLLAKLRLKQNRANETKSLSQKALTLDPKLVPAKLTLALAHFQLGEIEEARLVLSNISDDEISTNSLQLNMAQTLVIVGDCQRSLALAEKLPVKIKNGEALPLRAVCYLEAGDIKNFTSLIPTAKLLAKQNPAAAVKFAEILSKAGRHKETIDLLRAVTVASPSNSAALLLLAKSEIFLKDFRNAKIHLARAEKIDPGSADLLFVKAFLESEQGNTVQALELLEKSLVLKPDDTEILASFVVTAIRANQAGRAVRAAEKLLRIQPENLEFLYLYGAVSLQSNNLQAAETSLTRFLESHPNDPRGCLALGLTFAAQSDKFEKARRQMEHCLEINPNNFEAAYQLGLSYKTQGETAKAIKYLEDTVRISPNYMSALRDLGTLYLQNGEETKARPVLEKAVSINPDDAETHFQLSRLYNLLGETDLAKKHLKIFQDLRNPNKNGM